MYNRFNDREIKTLMNNLVILMDTREKKNHIEDWLKKKKIKTKSRKVDYGDYSCYIEHNKETDGIIFKDLYFDRDIAIERKKDLDELAGNLKDGASRLKSELAHLNKYGIRYYVFVEDTLFDKHIREGKYRSKYEPKTFYARLKGLESQYNTVIRPVGKEYIASEIYHTLYYYARNKLKHEGVLIDGETE